MPRLKKTTINGKANSRYVEWGITATFNRNRGRAFLPIVHDPKGHGSDPEPAGIYYRILKRRDEEAIQYFVYWKRQDCTKAYIGIGHIFSHDFDYEPIIAFIRKGRIVKIALSAAGDILKGGHQTEILRYDDSTSVGKGTYRTSKRPAYPFGIHEETTCFREYDLSNVVFRRQKPVLGLCTCYHVYTTARSYLRGPVLTMKLFDLTDDVLRKWYRNENFGHDVSNPWKYPHIRYHPSPKLRKLMEERQLLREHAENSGAPTSSCE